MALVGKLLPEGTMTLLSIRLPSLPDELPVEKKIVPTVVPIPEPLIVQFWIVLFFASLMKRMVVAVAFVLVLSIVNVPPPLIETLSAPFKSIRFPAIVPEMVRVPLGVIVSVAQEPPDG